MKNKFKSSAFWLSLTAGLIVLLNSLGSALNFSVNEVAITSVATSVIGILITIGVLSKDKSSKTQNTVENTNLENALNDVCSSIEEKTSELQEKVEEKSNKNNED